MTTSSVQTHTGAPDFAALATPFLDMQRDQWNTWVRFLDSLATFCRELREQWAVRFADAARIDD